MVPFGNIALLGMAASDGGWSFMSIATLVFAGIVAPIVAALLLARYWWRWQFVLVWRCDEQICESNPLPLRPLLRGMGGGIALFHNRRM